jgi:mRNA-degrading endonuclease YafQ of YafQ-DinJ toxin-antitoxin module
MSARLSKMKSIKLEDTHVSFSDLFNRRLQIVPDEIKAAFADALSLFLVDPDHPTLRNHELHGKFQGFRSIDVTEDYRALFHDTKTGDKTGVAFNFIGTHAELYG